jgi:hypothetical protein
MDTYSSARCPDAKALGRHTESSAVRNQVLENLLEV